MIGSFEAQVVKGAALKVFQRLKYLVDVLRSKADGDTICFFDLFLWLPVGSFDGTHRRIVCQGSKRINCGACAAPFLCRFGP